MRGLKERLCMVIDAPAKRKRHAWVSRVPCRRSPDAASDPVRRGDGVPFLCYVSIIPRLGAGAMAGFELGSGMFSNANLL